MASNIKEPESVPDKRVRKLTEKAQEIYNERVCQLSKKFNEKWKKVQEFLNQISKHDSKEDLKAMQRNLCLTYGEYRMTFREITSYLEETNTEESRKQLDHYISVDQNFDLIFNSASSHIESKLENLLLETFSRSNHSQSKSSSSSRSSDNKIKLLRKESELRKQKIDIDTELKILEEEKHSESGSQEDIVVPTRFYDHQEDTRKERTQIYVNSLQEPLNPCATEFIPDSNTHLTSELSKFMLRKDLSLSRLTRFDDKPENFATWKSTFKSVISDIGITDHEELDLLVKWLGSESVKHAISIRASTSVDPSYGLHRLWQRLEERYGAVEMVDASLKKKIDSFPKLTNRDTTKLYELSDIVEEILSHMQNPHYRDLLSYYNTSLGVIPIVNKLPLYIVGRWTSKASAYKREHHVSFPPFKFFAEFIRQMSIEKNDPGLSHHVAQNTERNVKSSNRFPRSTNMSAMKTTLEQCENNEDHKKCHFHNVYGHTLNNCRTFRSKPISVKKKLVRDKNLCFKCLESSDHRACNCPRDVTCEVCNKKHASALHVYPNQLNSYGGEKYETQRDQTERITDKVNLCAQVCGNKFKSTSCAKIVPVKVRSPCNPENVVRMYALLDDQSNTSLVKPEFFEHFDGKFDQVAYSLSTCNGKIDCSGRKTSGFIIESIDGSITFDLPPLTECTQIPDIRDEIPFPDAARAYSHLKNISHLIPEVDSQLDILMLLGRDIPEVHHVLDQKIGRIGEPFAQKLSLGWVIIGETCLGKVHKPNVVTANKTHVIKLQDGRHTMFPPCQNQMFLKDLPTIVTGLSQEQIFACTPDDNKPAFSQEDKEFIDIMSHQFVKTEDGHWSAPLPFRNPRPRLANNKEQAEKRARSLQASLQRNPEKQKHFVDFMAKIFDSDYAELAPPLSSNEECWYLPIFGVYHAQKGQIRVVFDSAAKYKELCLNSVLLQGPDLTNKLLGILMRFRLKPVAVIADLEQMFFQFRVHEKDRNFLRFFWFRDNNPAKEMIEYRMCVHVFGNSPSPAIATYGLRKSVSQGDQDVKDFVERDFYVDDGLASFKDSETAISCLKRTRDVLFKGGKLHLHKIASNDETVLKAFPRSELAKNLKDVIIGEDVLPSQRSLGISWNLNTDTFSYKVSSDEKPTTRRGVLSTINSLYDPIGFIAPITLQGKLIMRVLMEETVDWDQPLSEGLTSDWNLWKDSLMYLEQFNISRTYLSESSDNFDIHIFSDASEKAISAVVYMRSINSKGVPQLGFVIGKSKVAPKSGHTIPRLELCAAVLAVELGTLVSEHLGVCMKDMTFYTDSKIVLGVSRILGSTCAEQWSYVTTDDNPADQGTRVVSPMDLLHGKWLNGPDFLKKDSFAPILRRFELQHPDVDKEVRPLVQCCKTSQKTEFDLSIFETISSWSRLVKVIALLKIKARLFKTRKGDSEIDISTPKILNDAERFIIGKVQNELFSREIKCLHGRNPLPNDSQARQLNPFLDEQGLLRVGGRLKQASDLDRNEKHPLIVHRKHRVARLIAEHFHRKVYHQGCHFTEGAIRSGGFWLIGCKRLVRSIISKCVKCRKLRGKTVCQIMSDLPEDRLISGAPFLTVGVDVFGPWTVVARRTRGGVSCNKRWAVLFTCLTSRAVHMEVIEGLSTSSFINAMRRFIAIRGPVKTFRSDRGTNFVGAVDSMNIPAINVEDVQMKTFMNDHKVTWKFNSPYSSHMGGVWERLIGVIRRILDSMLSEHSGKLSHEVLSTLLAEVCLIVNSRPLVPVSKDPENPMVLSPMMLLSHKSVDECVEFSKINVKDVYQSQWKHVQCLANIFWKRWRSEYLQTLQRRSKWMSTCRNVCVGDIVLLVEDESPRYEWPMGIVTAIFPSADDQVRKVSVRIHRRGDSESKTYTRPITKLVMLIESQENCE